MEEEYNMPTQDITVREYVGSLANANLLTDDPTLLLTIRPCY
tara:strand:+ start:180 stop:305 length:126 start_codon:yes stop_codon:yes gene_type:complete